MRGRVRWAHDAGCFIAQVLFVTDVLRLVQRDKQWIINIQLNQLKCDNPYVDDYYFTMYQVCAI